MKEKPNDVVVTALSVHSPLGNTAEDFRRRMFANESGISDIRGVAVPVNFPVPYGALASPISGLPLRAERNLFGEFQAAILWLLQECLAGLPAACPIDAVMFGTDNHYKGDILTKESPSSFHFEPTEIIKQALPGAECISIANACTTGAVAIGLAARRIRLGDWERVVVGALESRLRVENIMPFYLLGALCTSADRPAAASRPFSSGRAGFVKAEGGGMLLLESRRAAEARGASPLASVVGFGQTSDGWRLTDGRSDVKGASKAIELALASAGISPEQIDYVNAHGTSTPLNDKLETDAIKSALGAHAYKTPVSSLKSQIGHMTVACGVIESIATILMLGEQRLSPTLNYVGPEAGCDLDYVANESRAHEMRFALKNSFGFGGTNASLIIKAERDAV